MSMPSIIHRSASSTYATSCLDELFSQRAVLLHGPITDVSSLETILQLSYLDKENQNPILLLIDSPGGSVYDGLAIIDCMRGLRSPVHTHAIGMAASMAAHILACGEPGHRTASPNTCILIHQPLSGGMSGQATDIQLAAHSLMQLKDRLDDLLSGVTGRTKEEIAAATDRDNQMSATDAVAFGLIDAVEPQWPINQSARPLG